MVRGEEKGEELALKNPQSRGESVDSNPSGRWGVLAEGEFRTGEDCGVEVFVPPLGEIGAFPWILPGAR